MVFRLKSNRLHFYQRIQIKKRINKKNKLMLSACSCLYILTAQSGCIPLIEGINMCFFFLCLKSFETIFFCFISFGQHMSYFYGCNKQNIYSFFFIFHLIYSVFSSSEFENPVSKYKNHSVIQDRYNQKDLLFLFRI